MNKIINLFAGPGDQDRFRALLAPHVQLLYQQAYRFTLNTADAEDLLQDVLLETFSKREVLYSVDNVGAWLSRCLYHRFIDRYRRRKRQPQFDDIDTLHDHNGLATQGEMETQLAYQQMLGALQTLSPKYRAVISLHDQLGFTLPELESIMDIPLGTLKSHLHRARKALKQTLDADLQGSKSPAGGQHEL